MHWGRVRCSEGGVRASHRPQSTAQRPRRQDSTPRRVHMASEHGVCTTHEPLPRPADRRDRTARLTRSTRWAPVVDARRPEQLQSCNAIVAPAHVGGCGLKGYDGCSCGLRRAHTMPWCLPSAAPPPRPSRYRAFITCVHGSEATADSAALVVPAMAGRVRVVTHFFVRSVALVSRCRTRVSFFARVDGRVAERYGGRRHRDIARNRQKSSDLAHPGLPLIFTSHTILYLGSSSCAPR